jgi:GNL3L/Grn1 putative GTPase
MHIELKKGAGIPNIFPYKEQLMNSLERKENLDKERKEQIKAMQQANQQMPKGTLEHYAMQV